MHHLVDEVSKSDQRQRESGEEIMASCGKALWKGIPNEQNYDVCQRYDTQDYRKSPVSPVKTVVHSPLLIAPRKEVVRAARRAAFRVVAPFPDSSPGNGRRALEGRSPPLLAREKGEGMGHGAFVRDLERFRPGC